MSDILVTVIMGIIQGLTEFLPVSSSGHLVIAGHFLGITEGNLVLTVAVHFGTILAVLIYFYRDIVTLVRGFFSGLGSIVIDRKNATDVFGGNEDFRLALFIIVATVPAGIVGLTLEDVLEEAFSSILAAGSMLILTATLLLATRWCGKSHMDRATFGFTAAMIVGIAQAIAIMPGISRSGATIAAALFLGTEKDWAARFSFLLSIPAVMGAAMLKARHLIDVDTSYLIAIAAGTFAAFLTGYLALVLLMTIVRQGRFYLFAWYVYPVGILAVIAGLW